MQAEIVAVPCQISKPSVPGVIDPNQTADATCIMMWEEDFRRLLVSIMSLCIQAGFSPTTCGAGEE
jgi:hypothetical protein